MYRADRLYRSMGELPNHPNRVHIYQRNTPGDDPNLKILNGQLVLMILLKLIMRNVHIYLSMFLKRKQII